MANTLGLPYISPEVALADRRGKLVQPKLRRLGRIAAAPLHNLMPHSKNREDAAYNNTRDMTFHFTDYWRRQLSEQGRNLQDGMTGATKLDDGTVIVFGSHGCSVANANQGEKARWHFVIEPPDGRELNIFLGAASYKEGEMVNGAVAARDHTQMTDLTFADGNTGYPISSYPYGERLAGYQTAITVMHTIEAADKAGLVELR